MTKPLYTHDGCPANLEAAAVDSLVDSLEWLRLMRFRLLKIVHRKEDYDRLERLIAALESFLPDREPVYEDRETE